MIRHSNKTIHLNDMNMAIQGCSKNILLLPAKVNIFINKLDIVHLEYSNFGASATHYIDQNINSENSVVDPVCERI